MSKADKSVILGLDLGFDRNSIQCVIRDVIQWDWAHTPDDGILPGYYDETLVTKERFEECATVLEQMIARVRATHATIDAQDIHDHNDRLTSQRRIAEIVRAFSGYSRKRGHVYIVRAKDGTHKIGQSQAVEKRIRSLGLGYVPEVVHLVASDHALLAEQYLHFRMRHARIQGEWFNLSKDDLAWLCAHEQINVSDVEALL